MKGIRVVCTFTVAMLAVAAPHAVFAQSANTKTAAPAKADAAKKDPAVTACIADINATIKQINEAAAAGAKAKTISASEAAENKKTNEALAADWKKKQVGGVTLAECQETHKSKKAQLEKMKQMAAKK